MQKYIDIKGARENNLKNIDIKIPKDKHPLHLTQFMQKVKEDT